MHLQVCWECACVCVCGYACARVRLHLCACVRARAREHVCTRRLSALPRREPASLRARASISPLSAPQSTQPAAPHILPHPRPLLPARTASEPAPVRAGLSPPSLRHLSLSPPPGRPRPAAPRLHRPRFDLPCRPASVAPRQARPSGSEPPCSASARPSARVCARSSASTPLERSPIDGQSLGYVFSFMRRKLCAPSSASTPLAPAYATLLRVRPAEAVPRPTPARRAVASSRRKAALYPHPQPAARDGADPTRTLPEDKSGTARRDRPCRVTQAG